MIDVADAELVARSRRADATAFGVLVERHQRLVFGVALARCKDPALAEEVAQEAFVTAWRDLGRLRDVERVGSWVAGIARNLAANATRKSARRSAVTLSEPAAVPTPEDEALAREDRELLARALADVPEAHRETLVLFYMEGQSVAAIAAALGIREDLVKQRLSRGRRALRESIETRIESALTRARVGPAFSVGVVTAIVASGAREASAATAGKAMTMVATKKVALAGVATLAIAGGAVWLGARARASDTNTNAPPSSDPALSSTAAAHEERAVQKSMVRRLASPADRAPLLEAIRRARASRAEAPAVPSRPAPTRLTPASDDTVDTEYIKSAVMDLVPLLRQCYQAGLERDPTLAGSVMLSFTIEGEPGVGGVVGDSKIDDAETTLVDPDVRECIQETMYALEIDPPSNGGSLSVRNQFAFSPQ
jgi:RNA polymerase sigma factor (sigma-70 family)